MIEDYARPAWAEAQEKFAANVAAALARLVRWLRRRARAKDETPAVTSHPGKDRRPPRRAPTDARPVPAKPVAPHASGAWTPRRD